MLDFRPTNTTNYDYLESTLTIIIKIISICQRYFSKAHVSDAVFTVYVYKISKTLILIS